MPTVPGAFERNRHLGRGVNVLGYDPLWKDRTKARFHAEHFKLIREAGFSHVRINLFPFRDSEHSHDETIGEAYLRTLDWVLDAALANYLLVILDFHEGKAEMAARVRYSNCVAREAERLGWSWAWWQFDSLLPNNFTLYDIHAKQWIEQLLSTLIPSTAQPSLNQQSVWATTMQCD